jgi:hypothetical protein
LAYRGGLGVADNGGMESAIVEHLVAAGGGVAEWCLRWVVFGESLPADRGCIEMVWPGRPMPI